MTAVERSDDERPPPILRAWANLYILEVVVLVFLIVVFTLIGWHY